MIRWLLVDRYSVADLVWLYGFWKALDANRVWLGVAWIAVGLAMHLWQHWNDG